MYIDMITKKLIRRMQQGGTVNDTTLYNVKTDDIRSFLNKAREQSMNGNVDLTNRPSIRMSRKMTKLWGIPRKGYQTVLTSTYSNDDGTVAMNFTPIVVDENGNAIGALTPQELDEYSWEVMHGVIDDNEGWDSTRTGFPVKKLKIGKTFHGENAILEAGNEAEEIHKIQEQLYDEKGKRLIPKNP